MLERRFQPVHARGPTVLVPTPFRFNFHNLTREEIGRIVDIQIERLEKRLADRHIRIVLNDSAKALLIQNGYDPVYGARPLKHSIQRLIENPLASAILAGKV